MSPVCIIIPCYNEEQRLQTELFKSFLKTHPQIHLLFVNDGSSDGTHNIINEICIEHSNALQLNHSVNSGKAHAVRTGILNSLAKKQYEFVGYLDADLATPLSELIRLEMEIRKRPEVKIILGSRWKRLGSRIERNWIRHYLGRIFATLVSILFSIEVYDTQCGAKIMRNEKLELIFQQPFVSKWFFDIEILLRLGIEHETSKIDLWALEFPLQIWNEVGNSHIKLKDFISVPIQLFKIKRKYGRWPR